MKQKKMNSKILILAFLLVIALDVVSAALELDSIQFDPAIIASGDEVDIVVQFHEKGISSTDHKVSNPDYSFMVELKPDDTLTKEYVEVQDSEGDDLHGSIFAGDHYNKRFRIKVRQDAPPGSYEFKLVGQWYYKGVKEGSEQWLRFRMPVKKEGIIIDVASFGTVPAEVRPGDDYVKVVAYVENAGEKDAKSVELSVKTPEGITASYTGNNRIWVGMLKAGESKEVTLFFDVDESAEARVYDVIYDFEYMDLDNNDYEKSRTLPFLVKSRPYIEVVEFKGEGLAGGSAKLYVTLKNTGTESAEAVDVRILKQSAQPFNIDVRSDYIGELEPGEQGVAIFDIAIDRNAEVKEHDFKLLVRSKGDSDEGDDNIYTYNRRAKFKVTGEVPNYLLYIGLVSAVAVIFGIIIKWGVRK